MRKKNFKTSCLLCVLVLLAFGSISCGQGNFWIVPEEPIPQDVTIRATIKTTTHQGESGPESTEINSKDIVVKDNYNVADLKRTYRSSIETQNARINWVKVYEDADYKTELEYNLDFRKDRPVWIHVDITILGEGPGEEPGEDPSEMLNITVTPKVTNHGKPVPDSDSIETEVIKVEKGQTVAQLIEKFKADNPFPSVTINSVKVYEDAGYTKELNSNTVINTDMSVWIHVDLDMPERIKINVAMKVTMNGIPVSGDEPITPEETEYPKDVRVSEYINTAKTMLASQPGQTINFVKVYKDEEFKEEMSGDTVLKANDSIWVHVDLAIAMP